MPVSVADIMRFRCFPAYKVKKPCLCKYKIPDQRQGLVLQIVPVFKEAGVSEIIVSEAEPEPVPAAAWAVPAGARSVAG